MAIKEKAMQVLEEVMQVPVQAKLPDGAMEPDAAVVAVLPADLK